MIAGKNSHFTFSQLQNLNSIGADQNSGLVNLANAYIPYFSTAGTVDFYGNGAGTHTVNNLTGLKGS